MVAEFDSMVGGLEAAAAEFGPAIVGGDCEDGIGVMIDAAAAGTDDAAVGRVDAAATSGPAV